MSMLDFVRQFYDKRVWWVLGGLLLTHLVAASVQGSVWAWVPLVAMTLATFVVSYRKLEYGLAIAFLELFTGGHGHLIDVTVHGFVLSIREVIFAAVMLAWFVQVVQGRMRPQFIAHRDWPFAIIAVAVIIGSVKGLLTNPMGDAFDDLNGFFTLLYFFPMISLPWTGEGRRLLLQTLAASGLWIAFTSLIMVYAFTHLPGLASHQLYTFVRDARLAEITLQTSGRIVDYLGASPWYFRVFQQSQATAALFELLLLAATLVLWRERGEKLPRCLLGMHALMIATILASISRSFWLGCLAGFGLILAFTFLTRPKIVTLATRHVQLAGLSIAAAAMLFLLMALPLPPRPDLSDSSFYKGRDENTREVAVSSRWNLLTPMIQEIWSSPIIGSGFGESVTYISDDPRLRAIDPSGAVTTYRFEWGYHDVWLKTGILGLLGFGWFYVTVLSVAWESVRRQDARYWIVVGLSAGLTMFYVAHIFSPYLNHPIGLGFMIFILPFFAWENRQLAQDDLVEDIVVTPIALPKTNVGIAFKR